MNAHSREPASRAAPACARAWVVAGLWSFFGAPTHAELGAMKPEAGGEYVYLCDADGPLAGFLHSWTWLGAAW